MREDESLSAYLTRLFVLTNQMKSMVPKLKNFEGELSKNRIMQKLLISLIKTYDIVCTFIYTNQGSKYNKSAESFGNLESF